jgi:hypothetical protein
VGAGIARVRRARVSVVQPVKGDAMCRNIKQLRRSDSPASDQELYEAALQYVRKVSGYRKPSRANNAAFESAVLEIAHTTKHLLENLEQPETRTSHSTG